MSISHHVTIEPVKFNTAAINLREDILDSAAMTGSGTSFQSPYVTSDIFWIADILDGRNV